MMGDDDIEPWDDFNEIDLSKKRYLSDSTYDSIKEKTLSKNQLIHSYYMKGYLIKEIAKELGINRNTVTERLKDHLGVNKVPLNLRGSRRTPNKGSRRTPNKDIDIIRKLRQQGYKLHQIGEKLGYHPNTIWKKLNRFKKEGS